MIYRMDSVEYFKLARHEPIESLVHTYYASIGTGVKTSGRLHPNVFNWSFAAPSSRFLVENDCDHELAKQIYYSEIESDMDGKVAPVLYEILKNGERLIILYSTRERLLMYPQMFCKCIEERYHISVYKYKENEMDRPYDVSVALHELKRLSKKAYNRKLISTPVRQLREDEVKYALKLLGVKPTGDLEEMQNQFMKIKREMMSEIRKENGEYPD